MTNQVFAVPVFFVVFREALETVIIVSVLLAFLKQTLDGPQRDAATYKKLTRQVWLAVVAGLVICLIIGAACIALWYTKGKDAYGKAEDIYEGAFSLFAAVIIGVIGATLLRVAKLQDKWRVKLAKALESQPVTIGGRRAAFKRFCEKYCMFIIPFITVLREGLEAIIFIGGVSFSAPGTSVPLPVVVGLIAGCFVGWLLYKGGSTAKLQVFLVISTCVLYLVAAGLFSKAVWDFEAQAWNNAVGSDADELGAGAGSYDISKSVWHVNFGNPEIGGGGGWGIFNAILGWTNSATYGSVISYNLYWLCVILGFVVMRYKEVNGHLPFMKAKAEKDTNNSTVHVDTQSPGSSGIFEKTSEDKKVVQEVHTVPSRTISE
ncbi:iron permease FTR1 family protein [Mollisia scopiformis]|uniref:Iron permease FTR1 family protein n=1 Tax=Mollisia scopiformis TaxID=149040 RepID=A0A132B870_MOLSC|nr:iron permease FTR1 family protein [Mollisia scopiformis]KUJ08595.1 iron permease FTR1 family protein [Mollisia scopiformis]